MPAPATPTHQPATTTPAAPPVTPPAAPVAPPVDENLAALISTFDDGGAGIEIQPAPEPAEDPAASGVPAEPEAPVTPQPADPAPAPVVPAAPAPAVKVTRKPGVTQEQLDAAIAKIRPPLPPEAPPAPAAPAGPDLSKLSEDQRDEYETLLWAEKNEPAAYAGKAKALLDGYQKVESYIATRASSGEPVEDPASDGELQRFIASNVPKPGRSELRRLERARITKEAKDEALKGVGAEIAEAKRLATVARVEPVVRGEIEKFKGDLTSELASDDPFESGIYKEAIQAATGYASQWLDVVMGITDPGQDFDDVFKFVVGREAAFRREGKDLVRDGKTFVTMAEWPTLTPERKAASWMFGRQDVLVAIKKHAVAQAKLAVEREEKALTERGFVRVTKAGKAGNPTQPAPAPAPSVAPIEAPSIGRSSAPGAGPVSPRTPEGREMTSTLGMS